MVLFELKNLFKSYRDNDNSFLQLLAGVNLSLHSGLAYSLIGPNGCGKTTLLRIITGIEKQDKGALLFQGSPIAGLSQHQRAKFISYVDQDSYKTIAGPQTVEEILSLASIRGKHLLPRRMLKERVFITLSNFSEEIANYLETLSKRPTQVLSGGQRQLLGLAAGLMGQPKIILLDEHLASLDEKFKRMATEFVNSYLSKENATALIVSHDKEWFKKNTNAIAKLTDGHISLSENY